MVSQDSKVHNSASSFLLLITTRFGCQAEIKQSVCISKSLRSLCISFSRTDSGLCIYHWFVWSNFNFLHNSQWINLAHPDVSSLILFFIIIIVVVTTRIETTQTRTLLKSARKLKRILETWGELLALQLQLKMVWKTCKE